MFDLTFYDKFVDRCFEVNGNIIEYSHTEKVDNCESLVELLQ